MKKKFLFTIFGMAFVVAAALYIVKENTNETGTIITNISQLHNGDAKFYKNNIITSVNGHLAIYDRNGKLVKEYQDIATNWLSCIEEQGIIVYGNGSCQLGVLQIDDDYNVVKNEIVMETENLQIDPTILKVKDTYYMTATEIIGLVNNADLNVKDGRYILHLYQSKDLSKWTLVDNVIDVNNNIEDVDIDYFHNRFYVFFEKEIVDKGDSSVCVAISDDKDGKEFSTYHELLLADCDHEPAAIEHVGSNSFRLYYSCDKNNKGQSYQGGQVFYADYDADWKQISVDSLVITETPKGILLYDVRKENEKLQLLYAKNYLTDCDLVVEEMK